MIKILFFIENLGGGGAEKVLRNLVNNMNQDKFQITVQTLWKENVSQYLDPGIRYRYCYSSRNKWNVFRSRVEAALGLTYRFHMKDTYDIEVAYLECGATKIIAGSTNKQAKKIAWVHCDLRKVMSNSSNFAKRTARWYKKYKRVICVSESVRKYFDEMFDGRFDSLVLHNVIDDVQIRAQAQAKISLPDTDGCRVLCAVGRLVKSKNYLRLLQVYNLLLKDGFNIQLWIVGEGPERKKLETFIADNGLISSVVLAGYQNNPYPFMAQADLLVCSSDYEGLSTVVSEGLVLGKPIVTTDCGGMREILGDSEFGLITEATDQALYMGLRKMLENPALQTHFAEKAMQWGYDHSANLLTFKTEQILEQIHEE